MSADSIITIAQPGWTGKRELVVAGVKWTQKVSEITTLSCHVTPRQVHTLGFDTLFGSWVRWYSPLLGNFGGIIRRTPTQTHKGDLEISVDTFHALFKQRRTRRTYKQSTGSAGGLAVRAITDVATDHRLYIHDIQADEDGPVLRIEWRGDDLFDLLDSMMSDAGYEWDVVLNDDWTISCAFRKRIGKNRLGKVLYADGFNVMDGQVAPSSENIVNDRLAISDDQRWENAPGGIAVDSDSVDQYGRLEDTKRYQNLVGISSLITRAKTELVIDAQPVAPTTVVVHAREKQLSQFTYGDSIRYWSARQNAQYEFRVMSRTYDQDAGSVTLTGDATRMAA